MVVGEWLQSNGIHTESVKPQLVDYGKIQVLPTLQILDKRHCK